MNAAWNRTHLLQYLRIETYYGWKGFADSEWMGNKGEGKMKMKMNARGSEVESVARSIDL